MPEHSGPRSPDSPRKAGGARSIKNLSHGHRELAEAYDEAYHELHSSAYGRWFVAPFFYAHVRRTLGKLRDGYALLHGRLPVGGSSDERVAGLNDRTEEAMRTFASRPVLEFAKRASPNVLVTSVTTAASGVGLTLSDTCVCWLWHVIAIGFPIWMLMSLIVPFDSARALLLKRRRAISGDGVTIYQLEEQQLRDLGIEVPSHVQWDVVGYAVISAFYFSVPLTSHHLLRFRLHIDLVLGSVFALITLVSFVRSFNRPHAWKAEAARSRSG